MNDIRVRIRPLADAETGPVLAVFDGLGPRSRERRFLAPKFRLTATDLCALAHVDGRDRVALVAELPDGRPVGIARFVRDEHDPATADVAVAVVDVWQRRGVGSLLAEALAECARALAVRRFTAVVLRDNEAVAGLLRSVGGDVRALALDELNAELEMRLAG